MSTKGGSSNQLDSELMGDTMDRFQQTLDNAVKSLNARLDQKENKVVKKRDSIQSSSNVQSTSSRKEEKVQLTFSRPNKQMSHPRRRPIYPFNNVIK